MEPLVTSAQIDAAADVLASVVRRTPLTRARVLDRRSDGPVYVKCENLQRTGSFKIRGAYHRIDRLSDDERAAGVVAASAGNHAQGVALASSLLGTSATVFMPERAPLPKLAATRGYGADVRLRGVVLEETLAEAERFAERTGAVFIHPFEHRDVVAGQATVGKEILEQLPEVATILVPTGGGGLLGGVAAAAKAVKPDVRVVGVQAEQAASFPASIAAGEPVRAGSTQTVADGIAVSAPGPITLAHVRSYVDDVVTVSEESLARAVLLCLERTKLVVEPAGAAAVAALLAYPGRFSGPVVVVLSGGNVDPLLLLRIIRHGLSAAGRFLSLRMRIPDRPGELAGLLALLGDLGANVIDVEHSRIVGALALGEVDLLLNLETRGEAHCAKLVAALERGGFQIVSATQSQPDER
jgi:threonine dehydratase